MTVRLGVPREGGGRSIVPEASLVNTSRSGRLAPLRTNVARTPPSFMRLAIVVLSLLVPALAHAGDLLGFAPSTLQRGTTTEVIVRTSIFADADRVVLSGDDLLVRDLVATDALLSFDVGTGAQAALGARDIAVYDGELLLYEAASVLEVVAGPVELLSLDPARAARGETLRVAVTGTNLDTIESFNFGDGVTASDWSAESPTRGALDVTVGGNAFSGLRDVTANTGSALFSLRAAFEVVGGALELRTVIPSSAERGEMTEVRIVGENMDTVTGVDFGPRIAVEAVDTVSPQQVIATIDVRRDASAGPRAVVLERGDESSRFEDVFTVRRGAIEVIEIRPDALRQRDATFLTIEGDNLDGLTSVDAGAGVDILSITATNPTSASVDVLVADDAALGLRDLRIVGPAGALTVDDALTIGEYVRPQPDLRFATQLEIDEVMIGGSGRSGIAIDNQGSLEETFTISGSEGDLDQFFLVDEQQNLVETLTLTLAPGELAEVPVWFVPELRGRRGARFVFRWDDPQVNTAFEFDVFGTGTTQDLLFSETPPFEIGELDAGAGVALPRLFTRLRDGVPGREVILVGGEVVLRRDGVLVDANANVELFSTSDELYWGLTEIDWSLDLDPGAYEGVLTIETDNPGARFRDLAFSLNVGASGGDGGADAGEDVGLDAGGDTGGDAGQDTGGSGASDDVGADARAPDASVTDAGGEDTATGEDAATRDADGSDTGTGGGSGGGCAAAATSTPAPLALLTLAALWRRRQRTDIQR